MGFSFSKKFNVERKFDIDTSDFEYCSLEELFHEVGDDEDYAFTIHGVYINSKGLYDDSPVLAIDDRYVNLPAHLTKTCQAMINDPQCVSAINNGLCGFTIYSYEQKRFSKICFGVKWVDM